MKEEIKEQSEKYAREHYGTEDDEKSNLLRVISKYSFQAGAKWGIANAIEWHDLRKDPTDLPKETGEYWCKWEDGTYCTAHYFEVGGFCDCTIAWCELPKFKEKE